MPGSHTSRAAPSPCSVGSPALAPSPTSTSPHQFHSQSATPTSSSFHTPTIAIAIRPSAAAPANSAPAPPLNKISMASVLTPTPQSGPVKGPVSMTSKEWVIPPRPKPGRKPATDTPPTKRKAQNRAAQRAFRERRAARVGELEEHLDGERTEHERIQRELKDRIQAMEVEAQTLRTRCQVLENMLERERMERRRWSDGTSQASSSRPGSVSLPPQAQNPSSGISANGGPTTTPVFQPQPSTGQVHGARHSTTSTSSGPALRNNSHHSFSISQIISPPEEEVGQESTLSCGSCALGGPCMCADEALANAVIGCGKCTLGTKCECLEASINATLSAGPAPDLKRRLRSTSPCSIAPDEKRPRADTALETDFTAIFASKKHNRPQQQQQQQPESSESSTPAAVPYLPLSSQQQQQQSIPPRDSCGFCKDGTYCVCADTLLPPVTTDVSALAITIPTTGPTSQVQTPPPSENDVVPSPLEVTATGAVKLPGLSSLRYGRRNNNNEKPSTTGSSCGPGGPGTCAQCLADPKSGLFCRSLAANFGKNGSSFSSSGGYDSGCCGGGGAGGCCKEPPGRTLKGSSTATGTGAGGDGTTTTTLPKLSLSCADAYKTLSSHRHFDEATDEIATWLPKLRAAPRPQTGGGGGGPNDGQGGTAAPRPALEVEAASIMSVLKGFDVRFGS